MNFRAGLGYDAHRLAEGRKLVIGGVAIPYEKGLLGHSDADVLVHAVIDAILGALGCGDIGRRFPDTDEKYKNISSLVLLEDIRALMHEKKYEVANIDTVIMAQAPKLAPYIQAMEENIAGALKIETGKVNVKATTEEGLGFTGDGSGIAAKAICLLCKKTQSNGEKT